MLVQLLSSKITVARLFFRRMVEGLVPWEGREAPEGQVEPEPRLIPMGALVVRPQHRMETELRELGELAGRMALVLLVGWLVLLRGKKLVLVEVEAVEELRVLTNPA